MGQYGLTSYVQTSDGDRARRLARRLHAGMIEINDARRGRGMPFGGVRHSGTGREGGQNPHAPPTPPHMSRPPSMTPLFSARHLGAQRVSRSEGRLRMANRPVPKDRDTYREAQLEAQLEKSTSSFASSRGQLCIIRHSRQEKALAKNEKRDSTCTVPTGLLGSYRAS